LHPILPCMAIAKLVPWTLCVVLWAVYRLVDALEITQQLKLGADIEAFNSTVSGKLRAVRRFDCSDVVDFDTLQEPLILTDCCFREGEADERSGRCPSPQDLNWSHLALAERCGHEDVSGGIGARTLAYLKSLIGADADAWNSVLRRNFNQSLDEIIEHYAMPWTLKDYHLQRHSRESRALPEHLAEYVYPLSLKTLRFEFCSALAGDVADLDYALPDLFKLPDGGALSQSSRKKMWEMASRFYVAPRRSFAHPTHVHAHGEAITSVLMEGKKVWQLVPWSKEAHEALQPHLGGRTEHVGDIGYLRAPGEVARDFPVYIAEQNVGEVLYMPRQHIHLVYNVQDTVSLNFLNAMPRAKPESMTSDVGSGQQQAEL